MSVKVNFKVRKCSAKRLLVIDADIIAYQTVLLVSVEQRHGDEWSWHVSEKAFKAEVTDRLDELLTKLRAENLILCFGSSGNWRRQVLQTYKANRSQKKPLGYVACKEWMMEEWPSLSVPMLEADDLCGLICTGGLTDTLETLDVPHTLEKILVSEDKDLRGIPGLYFSPRKPDDGIIEVSRHAADLQHLIQTLSGDATDNYKGCPGIGAKKGLQLVLKNAPNPWPAMVAAYEKAGLGEEAALVQARVARILRCGEYDENTGELSLWVPAMIQLDECA